MTKADLEKKLAYLEFVHDQLETEFSYLDSLLKSVGFPKGIISAKAVAVELLSNSEMGDSEFFF